MKTLSLEIRKKSFKRRLLGGLPSQEVKSYLETLSNEFEALTKENKDLSSKLQHTSKELAKMREMEQSLIQALDHAQRTSKATILQAKKEADVIVREGKVKAADIIRNAEAEARKLLDNAQREYNERVLKYKSEIKGLQKDYLVINQHTDVMVDELNRIMRETSVTINRLSELKKVANFKTNLDEPVFTTTYVNREQQTETKRSTNSIFGRKRKAFDGNKQTVHKVEKPEALSQQNNAIYQQPAKATLLDKLQSSNVIVKNKKQTAPKNLHEKLALENFLNNAHSA